MLELIESKVHIHTHEELIGLRITHDLHEGKHASGKITHTCMHVSFCGVTNKQSPPNRCHLALY
jgi:hypothetical protein